MRIISSLLLLHLIISCSTKVDVPKAKISGQYSKKNQKLNRISKFNEAEVDLEKNHFYPVHKQFLITGVELEFPEGKIEPAIGFNRFLLNPSKQVYTIPTAELVSLGIKEGTEISYIQFDGSQVKKFKFRKTVQIAAVDSETNDTSAFRTFYIYLSHEDIGDIRPPVDSGDEITGLAYYGEDFKLKRSKLFQPSYKELSSLSDQLKRNEKMINNHFSKSYEYKDYSYQLDKMSESKLNEVSFIIAEGKIKSLNAARGPYEESSYGLLLKTKDGLTFDLGSEWLPGQYSSYPSIKIGNFLEGFSFVILQSGSGMHTCSPLVMIEDGVRWVIPLKCDSGGC